MTVSDLAGYSAQSGRFVPVWTLEIQTVPEDTDRILDAVMAVHPLGFGRYRRNASISAVGMETAQPEPCSTTTTHVEGFAAGNTETYPMVELKVSIERDPAVLEQVMDLRRAGDFPTRRLGQPRELRPQQRQPESLVEQRAGTAEQDRLRIVCGR
jgi:hypothetical protein